MRLRIGLRDALASLAFSALVLAIAAMPVVPALASVEPVPVIDVKNDCDITCKATERGGAGCAQGTCKGDAQKVGCEDSYCGYDTSDDTKCACRK